MARVALKSLGPKARMQALGRLKTGQMNATERAYGQLLELRKRAGEIAWYKFEGLKLRLADNTFYTPDYAVMPTAARSSATRSRAIGPTTRASRSRSRPRSTRSASSPCAGSAAGPSPRSAFRDAFL